MVYFQDDDHEKSHRSYLAPPMPPVIHGGGSRLRRVNSSTLSLNKTKKKLLTVEELYVEVLYTILHMIGCDIDQVFNINYYCILYETRCKVKIIETEG